MNIQASGWNGKKREKVKDLKICSFDIGGIDLVMAREWEWEWVKEGGWRLEIEHRVELIDMGKGVFLQVPPNNYSCMSNFVNVEPSNAHQQPPRRISEDRT